MPRSRRSWIEPLDVVDVFVYVLVLNLATQFVPQMITETFVVSVLTAILLKLVLEVVVALKKRVTGSIRTAPNVWRRVISIVSLVALLPGSKFVVLLLVDAVFGESVSLGGFWLVTLLILALMGARALVRIAFEGVKGWDGAG
ncbi:hypothetical protein LG299_11245 [Microbacterium lacus]|uniref:hypothetical protein n=1 Tax=Microbacterium lacus TaxID=415217 RepID=UPI00384F358E